MEQRIECLVDRITEDSRGRRVYLSLEGQRDWMDRMQLQVPVEQPLSVGDKIVLRVEWPAT